MPRLAIRLAAPCDGDSVAAVFHAAIHGKAARSYTARQLAAWGASRTGEDFRQDIALGMNPFLVAEVTASGTPAPDRAGDAGRPIAVSPSAVIGFGALRDNEVAYLYAAPQAPPGAGGALLRELERHAAEQGRTELRLTASLNALHFYMARGYRELRRDLLLMPVEGACVQLVTVEARKRLGRNPS